MTSLAERYFETLVGCRHPIVLAGMGGVARSDLVAAVSRAGGFGFLGMVGEPPALIRREVKALRAGGIENFGVNIIPAATDPPLLAEQIATIVDLGVPAVCLFWEIDADVVRRFRDAGLLVFYQVGSPEEAASAARAGAQVIIAQGFEAGGHVRDNWPLRRLLPAVIETVDLPVLATGGLATGADLVTARALGASGVVLGTALMAAEEAFAHPYHQQRLLAAEAHDTLLADMFHINWPRGARVRVLKGPVTDGALGDPWREERQVIGEEEGRPIYLFSTDSPLRSMTGDFSAMALYAGTGVGAITAIRPAAAIIGDIVREAETLLAVAEASEKPDRASPVCYADEISADYMGLLDEAAAAVETAAIIGFLRACLLAAFDAPGPADEPPFPATGQLFARHLLALRPFADAVAQPSRFSGLAPAALPAILLQQLHGLAPRLPEGGRRRALAALQRDLENGMA